MNAKRLNQKGIVQIYIMLLLTLFLTTGAAMLDLQRAAYGDYINMTQINQARFLAVSGLQEAKYFSMKQNGSFEGTSGEQVVTVDGKTVGSYEYTISHDVNNLYTISATGYVPNKTAQRKVFKTLTDKFTYNYFGQGIVILGSDEAGALNLGGNASINVNGGRVLVNSNHATGTQLSGNAKITAAEIDLVGGYSLDGNSKITGPVKTGVDAITDPFAYVIVPDPYNMTVQSNSKLNAAGDTTLQPGVYKGGIAINNGTLTLAPGNYYIEGGGIAVTGNANIVGNGVFIYNAPSSDADAVTFSGNGNFSLTPPTTGPYRNMVLFQDRDATAPLSITGNGSIALSGAIYAANAGLSISGNGKSETVGSMDVVKSLTVSGNGFFSINVNAVGQ